MIFDIVNVNATVCVRATKSFCAIILLKAEHYYEMSWQMKPNGKSANKSNQKNRMALSHNDSSLYIV